MSMLSKCFDTSSCLRNPILLYFYTFIPLTKDPETILNASGEISRDNDIISTYTKYL